MPGFSGVAGLCARFLRWFGLLNTPPPPPPPRKKHYKNRRHRRALPNCHSARSEAESQNLMGKSPAIGTTVNQRCKWGHPCGMGVLLDGLSNAGAVPSFRAQSRNLPGGAVRREILRLRCAPRRMTVNDLRRASGLRCPNGLRWLNGLRRLSGLCWLGGLRWLNGLRWLSGLRCPSGLRRTSGLRCPNGLRRLNGLCWLSGLRQPSGLFWPGELLAGGNLLRSGSGGGGLSARLAACAISLLTALLVAAPASAQTLTATHQFGGPLYEGTVPGPKRNLISRSKSSETSATRL